MKNIVILGGSYGGISTAHRILKQATTSGPFKITLVSPDTHLYWSMASPRALLPGQFSDDKIFQPVAAGFDQYSPAQFEFVLGSAESVDFKTRKIEVSKSAGRKTLAYDFLVIATGTHTDGGTPFKGLGSTEATKDALHDFQARVKNAKTIVIAGAGATGVEFAGELGFEYGQQKEIILITSGPTILQDSPASVAKYAMKALQNLSVKVKLQTKVVADLAPMSNGQQELVLSGGEKLITDMYVRTYGWVPNSSFIPAKSLNDRGFVVVDEYLKVPGAGDVWAIGDVSEVEPSQFLYCDKQSAHTAKNITLMLSGKAPLPYKMATSRILGVSIGKKAATASYGSMQIPSFIIIRVRKLLFSDGLVPTVNGSLF